MAPESAVETVVDATVVEEHVEPHVGSTELVRRERRSEVLRPLDADQLADSFRQYQSLLPRLLEASDYQEAGGKRFVKKSGWRKIATAFDLDVVIVTAEVDRDEQGHAVRAKVIARAIAPSGRTMDGDGYCSIDESRFTSRRADLSKVENDLRTTATTRAKNRAIADLVGMGDVSAEELGDPEPVRQQAQGPKYGPKVDDLVTPLTIGACKKITGDEKAARELWRKVATVCDGYMPQAAAFALIAAGGVMTTVPWDPEHVDPTGDVPTHEQATNRTTEPSAAEIAGLEDQLLQAWVDAGVSARTATKRVQDCHGHWNALQKSLEAASGAAAKREQVRA